MQATHECCAFKSSERPPFLGQATLPGPGLPGQKALSLQPFAKTHSSSQHAASMVQRKQECLWSRGEAPPVPPACTRTTPLFRASSTGPNPGTRPTLLSRAFPSPRWCSEATRAPEPSLGAWIPRPLAQAATSPFGRLYAVHGRKTARAGPLPPLPTSAPACPPHWTSPGAQGWAGAQKSLQGSSGWASRGHGQSTQKVAKLMSIYRQGTHDRMTGKGHGSKGSRIRLPGIKSQLSHFLANKLGQLPLFPHL